MLPNPVAHFKKRTLPLFYTRILRIFLPRDPGQVQRSLAARIGLASSGLFLVSVGLWTFSVSPIPFGFLSWPVTVFGVLNLALSATRRVALVHSNALALLGHFSALLTYYFLATRFVTVTYSTDAIVGTYMGVLKVLELQNPYLYSIKPFLDKFAFPPSYYTPRVDGSFEFHLNYPAFNFLTLIPLYLAGLRDLRDGIFLFHILSIMVIFGLVPSRLKSVSLAPFAFGFPMAVVGSWTDGVWAFLLLLSTVAWYRDRRLSLALVGLAGATKQIALVVSPFLLIRFWHEAPGSKQKRLLTGLVALFSGFIIPNLPFIISSPSAWWKGTIDAYLPGNAPQVAGGVGLSEILINLGLSPPSSFFMALMAMATIGTLYVYNKRFSRYKHFCWAMPILILFFYYRSFPNYLVYWLFPLVPELLRYKPGGVNWHPISMLRSITWRPPTGHAPFTFQRRLTAPLLLVILLTAVLAGVSGAYISSASTARVSVQIDGVGDPDRLGLVTNLNVTLTNTYNEPVSPRFFMKWSFLPLIWSSNSTRVLSGNSEASYLLSATDALAAIPRGAMFRVLVFNSLTGELAGESKLTQASIMPPGIANPQFKWWTLDSSTARKVPFGWKLLVSNADTRTSGVEGLDQSLAGGIRMELNNTVSERIPSQVALLQRLSFNATIFDMLALRPPTSDFPNSALFGVQIWDGQHLVYFVLSDSATSRSTVQFAENTTVTIPLGTSSWTWVHLDAQSEWSAQGWLTPRWVDISVFLKADARGVYAIGIGQVLEASI